MLIYELLLQLLPFVSYFRFYHVRPHRKRGKLISALTLISAVFSSASTLVSSAVAAGNINQLRISSAMFAGDVPCTVGRYFTEMLRGDQFGELRHRGSLIDDEEQPARLVFTATRVVVIVVIAPRMPLFCQPGSRTAVYFPLEDGISQHVPTYDINHAITRQHYRSRLALGYSPR